MYRMQKKNGTIIYSASDLSSFMQCRRRGALDMAAIRDNRAWYLFVLLLLVGKPGVSKTAVVREFFRELKPHGALEDVFVLETDEGTSNLAIKGMVDLVKLYTSYRFEICAPITKASCILINEIDKAGTMIRNSLLGIMNERMPFANMRRTNRPFYLMVSRSCRSANLEQVGWIVLKQS